MPRIYDSSSEPVDYCRRHFPSLAVAERRHGHAGHGPDGRGDCFAYDAAHPPYDGEGYSCKTCGRELTDHDE